MTPRSPLAPMHATAAPHRAPRRGPQPAHHYVSSVIVVVLAMALSACGDEGPGEAPARTGPPVIATSIAPLTWVAERLVQGDAKVVCPLPSEADPATWVPTPEAVQVFQSADLVLVNGAGFEAWLPAVSLPRRRLVDTTHRLSQGLIASDGAALVHSHGDGKAHRHGGVDGHTWMDPQTLSEQASFVREALIELMPTKASEIRARFAELRTELAALHERLTYLGPPDGELRVVGAQPGYAYLARRHGWTLTTLDLRPTIRPTDSDLQVLRAKHNFDEAQALFWDRAPNAEIATLLQERLALISTHVSLGLHPPQGDYGVALRANIEALESELGDP